MENNSKRIGKTNAPLAVLDPLAPAWPDEGARARFAAREEYG